ncbi:MAG: GlsB/YeaQ/YmgE family stress response membrane protein [Gemmatimonadaceae bacterium]
MGLIYSALAGLCAGAIARFLYPGAQAMSWLKTMLLGIGGGLLAGFVGRITGWYGPGQGAGLIASVLGALLILFIIAKRSKVA